MTQRWALPLSYGLYVHTINPNFTYSFLTKISNLVSIRNANHRFKKNKKTKNPQLQAMLTQPLCLLTLTLMLMLTKTQLKVLTAVEAASVTHIRPKASARVGKMM